MYVYIMAIIVGIIALKHRSWTVLERIDFFRTHIFLWKVLE